MRMSTISLAMVLVSTVACGGGSRPQSSTGVSGAYEFVVTSNVTGGTTLVEANLSANGEQSSATGPSQVQILSLQKKTWYVNGICPGETPGQNSVNASAGGSNITLNFNEGGNTLPGLGVLTGTTITGNYSVTGSSCPALASNLGFPPGSDAGGFVGNQVPDLAGTFVGYLTLTQAADNSALTLTEGADRTLTVSAALTGPADNGTFILAGSAVGNVMFVSGSVSGRMVSLFGYFDSTGAFTGTPNSMLIFNYDTLANVGLLTKQ